MRCFTTFVIAAVVAFYPAGAVIAAKLGTSAAPFLKIGAGARACGIGEAFTAASGNAESINWNPGALAFLEKNQAEFMHNLWAENVYMEYLAVAVPLPGLGTPALSATYLWMPSIEVNDDLGRPTGESWKVYDLAVSLGWALRVTPSLGAGTALKIIHRQLGGYSALGFALDGGVLWQEALPGVDLGASIQNLGPAMKFINEQENLPLSARLGSWWRCWSDPLNEVSVSVDGVLSTDNDPYPAVGVEYVFENILSLRAGYTGRQDIQSLSAGFGFRDVQETYTAGLDYAFTSQTVSQPSLGYTHRISMMTMF